MFPYVFFSLQCRLFPIQRCVHGKQFERELKPVAGSGMTLEDAACFAFTFTMTMDGGWRDRRVQAWRQAWFAKDIAQPICGFPIGTPPPSGPDQLGGGNVPDPGRPLCRRPNEALLPCGMGRPILFWVKRASLGQNPCPALRLPS